MKRFLVLLLVCVLMLSIFAGCGKEESPSGEPNENTTEVKETKEAEESIEEVEKEVNVYGWEVPEETATISFYYGEDNPDSIADAYKVMKQYLLDEFNLDVVLVAFENAVPERLSLMLASSEYPDVLTVLDPTQAEDWKQLGKTIDMKPYIDEYSPDFLNELGDMYGRFVDENGEMRILPNYWGALMITDNAPQVRYDWYQEIGEPDISTPAKYIDALKKMVEKHPTNAEGQPTYALAFAKDRNAIKQVGAIWGLAERFKVNADNSIEYFVGTDEGLEMVKFVNEIHRAGLLDPDSFIFTLDEWRQKLANQRYAGYLGAWWPTRATCDFWPDQIEDYDVNTHYYAYYNVVAEGVEMSKFNPKGANGYYRAIVTDLCEDPELIAKFINVEHTPLGSKLFGLGVPASYGPAQGDDTIMPVWDFADNAAGWDFEPQPKEDMLNSVFNYEAHWHAGPTQVALTMYQAFREDDGTSCWYDQNFNNDVSWKKAMNENMAETMFDFSAFKSIAIEPDSNMSIIKEQIFDVSETMFVEAVMADTEEECIAKYNEMVEKCEQLGLAEMNEYYSEQHKSILEAWK